MESEDLKQTSILLLKYIGDSLLCKPRNVQKYHPRIIMVTDFKKLVNIGHPQSSASKIDYHLKSCFNSSHKEMLAYIEKLSRDVFIIGNRSSKGIFVDYKHICGLSLLKSGQVVCFGHPRGRGDRLKVGAQVSHFRYDLKYEVEIIKGTPEDIYLTMRNEDISICEDIKSMYRFRHLGFLNCANSMSSSMTESFSKTIEDDYSTFHSQSTMNSEETASFNFAESSRNDNDLIDDAGKCKEGVQVSEFKKSKSEKAIHIPRFSEQNKTKTTEFCKSKISIISRRQSISRKFLLSKSRGIKETDDVENRVVAVKGESRCPEDNKEEETLHENSDHSVLRDSVCDEKGCADDVDDETPTPECFMKVRPSMLTHQNASGKTRNPRLMRFWTNTSLRKKRFSWGVHKRNPRKSLTNGKDSENLQSTPVSSDHSGDEKVLRDSRWRRLFKRVGKEQHDPSSPLPSSSKQLK